MSVHKCPNEIAYRALELVEARAKSKHISVATEMRRLGLSRSTPTNWRYGMVPETFTLLKLVTYGYDISYILTGRRTDNGNQ